MKCDYCMNSRPIISENGTHYSCCLTSQQLKKCLTGEKDYFAERPCISKIFIEKKEQ
jgi:hypothetical protein